MAGIYGPGRLPQLEKLKRGEPLAVAADGYLNLIHVDDIVRIISELDRGRRTGTLNVSDGHPVQRSDFYKCMAELTGSPAPAFETPPTGSSRAARARGSKKISNRRLVKALQSEFMYPSYREGLQAIVCSNGKSQEE
jgi:nucleoside-diphosphate-sugar epimerase